MNIVAGGRYVVVDARVRGWMEAVVKLSAVCVSRNPGRKAMWSSSVDGASSRAAAPRPNTGVDRRERRRRESSRAGADRKGGGGGVEMRRRRGSVPGEGVWVEDGSLLHRFVRLSIRFLFNQYREAVFRFFGPLKCKLFDSINIEHRRFVCAGH